MLVLTNIFELMQQDQIKIFDFIFSVILVILINCFIFWFVKRKLIRIIISLTSIIYIITSIFLLDSTSFILFGVITIVSLLALFVNMAETRYLFANKMSIRKLNKNAYIIFTTAHTEFSLIGYKYKTFGFLSKPITYPCLQ